MNASWRTSLAGLIGAIATWAETVTDPAWVNPLGKVLAGISIFLLGMSARDNKVSSEQAGAK